MKPIIVYVDNTDTNTVTLSKSDLESYIKQAYEQGKADGSVVIHNPITTPTYPNFPWQPTVVYCTTTSEINC